VTDEPREPEGENRAGTRVPLSWNRDVVMLSDAAQALLVRLLVDSAERLSDGRIPALVMAQQTVHLAPKVEKATVDELTTGGLLDGLADGGFYLPTWKAHNLSKARVESLKASRKGVAVAGGRARAEIAERGPGGKFLPKHLADEPAGAPAVRLDDFQPEHQPEDQPETSPVSVSVSVSVPDSEEEPFLEGGVQKRVEEPEGGFWARPVRATR
jgi:hypothetical protein